MLTEIDEQLARRGHRPSGWPGSTPRRSRWCAARRSASASGAQRMFANVEAAVRAVRAAVRRASCSRQHSFRSRGPTIMKKDKAGKKDKKHKKHEKDRAGVDNGRQAAAARNCRAGREGQEEGRRQEGEEGQTTRERGAGRATARAHAAPTEGEADGQGLREGAGQAARASSSKLQEWVKYKGLKVCVIFEGRDGAGKGGTIKAITERVSPRVFRTIALPAPTEREKSQMYVQRYLPHLPAAGEIVIFDRSWYNRAGVERVMGFYLGGRGQEVPEHGAAVGEGDGGLGRDPAQVLARGERGGADAPSRGPHRRRRGRSGSCRRWT